MGKGLHKLFKAVGNYISQVLPILGESGSEVPCFIPEPRNFAEVTRLSEDIQKPWLKANMKEVKNLINDQTFLVQEPYKGDPVTPCMDVYKVKIQSDGILDTLKLRIVVIVDLYKKKLFWDTWSPTASMSNLKYFLVYAIKHKSTVHQLYFIGLFLRAQVKNRVFLKLESRYSEYFPEYSD